MQATSFVSHAVHQAATCHAVSSAADIPFAARELHCTASLGPPLMWRVSLLRRNQ